MIRAWSSSLACSCWLFVVECVVASCSGAKVSFILNQPINERHSRIGPNGLLLLLLWTGWCPAACGLCYTATYWVKVVQAAWTEPSFVRFSVLGLTTRGKLTNAHMYSGQLWVAFLKCNFLKNFDDDPNIQLSLISYLIKMNIHLPVFLMVGSNPGETRLPTVHCRPISL